MARQRVMCPRCRSQVKTWEGSDPRCAFSSGAFTDDNWNCATANALRVIAERFSPQWSEDQYAVAIPLPCPIGDDESNRWMIGNHLILGWYKMRGRTEQAFLMTKPGEHLTLAEAESIISAFEHADASPPE